MVASGLGALARGSSVWLVSLLIAALLMVAVFGPGGMAVGERPSLHLHPRLDAGLSPASVDSTAPAAVGQSDGVEDLFWMGPRNAVMHAWYVPGGGWAPAQKMGGSMNSGPSPVTSGGGVLDVFWQGSDGNLWHVWYVSGNWYGPGDLGMGPLGGAPRAVSSQAGVVDVFWRGTDDGLWHAWYVNGWYGPQELVPGGSVLSDPDPVSDANGTIQLFYNGTDGAAHEVTYVGRWSGQTTLASGTIWSLPHATVVGGGQIDLVWQGTDGGLWYDDLSGGGWAGPRYGSAGVLGSQPDPVSTVPGRADVYWEGSNGWLWEEQISGGNPHHLQELPTSAMGSEPDPDITAPGAEDVFWRGQNGGIWHEWGDGNSSWQGPQQLAAPPPTSITLAVPVYHQQEALTCEEAALRMAFAYFGIGITEQQVLNAEGVDLVHYWTGPGGGDPFADFVGSPNGSEIANTGYGAYWSAIARATTDLGGGFAWAGMGLAPGDVYNAILSGEPVIFWVPYDWDTPARDDYTAFDGRSIPYAGPEEHAMVVVGVTPTEVEVNDPDRGQYWVSRSQFEANFAVYGDMAVVIG